MSWQNDLRRGEIGEGVSLSYLHALPNVLFIQDVRKEKKWQQADVDFLVHTETQVTKVEVKTEMAYKNFFYESESFGKVGCCERSQADVFLVYLSEMNGKLLQINVKKIRDYVHTLSQEELKTNKNGDSKGYSIPIELLISKQIAKVVFEGEN